MGPLGRRLKQLQQYIRFSQAAREWISSQKSDKGIRPDLLSRLCLNWRNSWSATEEFLLEMAKIAAIHRGPILECGTGLSTLVLGFISESTGNPIYSLEQDPSWFERVRKDLLHHHLRRNRVILAKLKKFTDYEWYDWTQGPPLPRFAFVVCDGPPGISWGGRYGLLPQMRDRLMPGCIILLDDAGREGEREILGRWKREYGITYELIAGSNPFAKIILP